MEDEANTTISGSQKSKYPLLLLQIYVIIVIGQRFLAAYEFK